MPPRPKSKQELERLAKPNTGDSGDLYKELSKYLSRESFPPTVPATTPQHIERVLKSWKNGRYPLQSKTQLAVVILSNPDSLVGKGLKGLNGADARMAEHLLPIARRLGFSVCLSTVTKSVIGIPDKEAWVYPLIPARKRARFGDHENVMEMNDGLYMDDPMRWAEDMEAYRTGEYDADAFDMGQVDTVEYHVSKMVDISGKDPVNVGNLACIVDQSVVLPKDELEDEGGEEEVDFDPESGELTYTYAERACLILFRDEDKPKVLQAQDTARGSSSQKPGTASNVMGTSVGLVSSQPSSDTNSGICGEKRKRP